MMRHRARRRAAGFILIWGSKGRITSDGAEPVQAVCPVCQQQAMFAARKVQRWFTLFFIPVFPIGSAQRFCECTACGQQLNRPVEMLSATGGMRVRDNAFAPRQGPAGDSLNAQAMRTHHEMLASPTDSATLLKLINLYLQMGEPADAKAACRAFPVAYENSTACAAAMRGIL